VAGAPPDAFTDLGQLWGNPLYDWSAMRSGGYRWWVERLGHHLRSFDAVRLDHFRGFVAYWAVPAGAADARSGRWRRGPGLALFAALQRELGADLPLVAEDLGVITPPVERLRDTLDLPGMIVLQFGFGRGAERSSPHAFVNHRRHRFVYTGTHDHDTARGWYESLDAETRGRVDALCASLGIADTEPWWRLVQVCLRSEAAVAICQAQDILGLGSAARMNNPIGGRGNWRWQLQAGALDRELAARLREATVAAGRG
jgi:4-alpha-glucanotransferase